MANLLGTHLARPFSRHRAHSGLCAYRRRRALHDATVLAERRRARLRALLPHRPELSSTRSEPGESRRRSARDTVPWRSREEPAWCADPGHTGSRKLPR